MISLFNKFKVAFNGLYIALKDKSILLQFIIAAMVLIFGFIYKFTNNEWLWIISCIFIVILSEMLNTCVEYLCNLIDPSYNEKIKKMKFNREVNFPVIKMIFDNLICFQPHC